MSGIIVDEPYTVNERYGVKYYSVTVDSPDWNQPIHWYSEQCKVTNTKKIAKIRQRAIDYARAHREADSREWKKVAV